MGVRRLGEGERYGEEQIAVLKYSSGVTRERNRRRKDIPSTYVGP